MEDDLTVFAVAGVAGAVLLLLAVLSLTARGGKARRRIAALAPQKDRTQSGARSVDPVKRRKAIAESLKEFETEKEKKRITIEQRIAQAGLNSIAEPSSSYLGEWAAFWRLRCSF